ncbi:UNVERIFIED_CONTAM: hypothetical protein HDU68_006017 [Siphonaria sp. JEL0065]|nr:hypothetical protein HDU68_006017 [Siphonaria sp. JEL0065]
MDSNHLSPPSSRNGRSLSNTRGSSQTRQPRGSSQTRRPSATQVQFDLPMHDYPRPSTDTTSSAEFMDRSSRTRLVDNSNSGNPEFARRNLHGDLKFQSSQQQPPKNRSKLVNTLVRLYTKYYRVLVMCHFLFILFNCGVLIPLTYVIHDSEITPDLLVAYRSVLFTRYLTMVSAFFYLWTFIILTFDKMAELNAKLWKSVLGLKRRVLFWDTNCNELSSVWWYAIFNALAIYVNLILIVMEELKYLTDAREEVIEYYTKNEMRSNTGRTAGLTSTNVRVGF